MSSPAPTTPRWAGRFGGQAWCGRGCEHERGGHSPGPPAGGQRGRPRRTACMRRTTRCPLPTPPEPDQSALADDRPSAIATAAVGSPSHPKFSRPPAPGQSTSTRRDGPNDPVWAAPGGASPAHPVFGTVTLTGGACSTRTCATSAARPDPAPAKTRRSGVVQIPARAVCLGWSVPRQTVPASWTGSASQSTGNTEASSFQAAKSKRTHIGRSSGRRR